MMLTEIRLLTVDDYHRMIEAAVFAPEEHLELLAGQLVNMMPKGKIHTAAVKRAERLLDHLLGELVLIRLQDPIELRDYSEPEPDIAVVALDPQFYEDHHPQPSEIYLLIEVADSSLKRDCETKAQIYAQSGIEDYWALDVRNRQLHIFRTPTTNGYVQHRILSDAESIALLAFPHVTILVADMLRSP
jgi:Uma2 family endonuclease